MFKKSFRNRPKTGGKKKKQNKAIEVFNFFADLCSNEDSDLMRSDFSRLVGKR